MRTPLDRIHSGWKGAALLLALLAPAPALAHGESFELRTISASPADADELWGVVANQGVVWSADGGGSWRWICDSALGATRVYDVEALGDGSAAAGLLGGIVVLDQGCGVTSLDGVPESSYADHLVADGDALLAAVAGAEAGGIYRCLDGVCAPTDLYGEGVFVKSILAVDGGFLATATQSADLSAALYASADGLTWEARYAWPDGDVDPRVLYAEGDQLLVWAIPRETTGVARLLRSEDGGLSFASVYATDAYTTAEGSVVALPDGLLFGHDQGLVLWSEDGGQGWEDRSADLPTVVCGLSLGARGLICADHLYDGIDLAESEDGWVWTPIACLEEATLPACAEQSCAGALDAWTTQAGIGGGRCDEILNAPAESEAEGGCGCGGEAEGAALWLPALLGPLWRRGRRRPVA